MRKKEADSVASAMETAGYTHISMMRQGHGEWAVSGICMDDFPETVTVDTPEQWAERSNGATPQSGAPLKYNEPTQQVSITVPVSVLAAADAGGRGQRSAWFVQAARAWMAREGEQ